MSETRNDEPRLGTICLIKARWYQHGAIESALLSSKPCKLSGMGPQVRLVMAQRRRMDFTIDSSAGAIAVTIYDFTYLDFGGT
ncbi:uncharacterized protein MYCFIDRAFT_174998 [Pseudocercospora fijiensis CIRAD86]|uniref:Uncharacterized protein n=1 Tax=Pseudocercospora fijiensis (strain CIRAD86) TaxID=383855 RepID=M3B2G9_PSEFD|nr:uncharacterized protein MYCFIDRAFT_174998 [Pseudocercospora fijiensis CIRAD86]EME83568.1 hypothetical protein MYCFIDRAFT_174998 [Pseudocercospora fijiensis CIRAD86]